jgi:hypothetical protein
MLELMLQKTHFLRYISFIFIVNFCAVLQVFVCLIFETILKVHLYGKRKISDILDFLNAYNRGFYRAWMIQKILHFLFCCFRA